MKAHQKVTPEPNLSPFSEVFSNAFGGVARISKSLSDDGQQRRAVMAALGEGWRGGGQERSGGACERVQRF
jgi:hypothetical protein